MCLADLCLWLTLTTFQTDVLGVGTVAGTNGPAVLLDRREADFLEDGSSGRVIARIQVELRAASSGVFAIITASAVGPGIDGTLGYEGIRGGNLMTAREIDRILKLKAIRSVTRNETGRDVSVPAKFTAGRRGRIAVRRVNRDGRIDVSARSVHSHPLDLIAGVGPVANGRFTTSLIVRGSERLRVAYAVSRGRAEILSVKSIAANPIREILK